VQEGLKELVCRIDTRQSKPDEIILRSSIHFPWTRERGHSHTLDLPNAWGPSRWVITDFSGQSDGLPVAKTGPDGLFVDNKWNVPQTFLSTRMQILVHAKSIPAMGYETFRVIRNRSPIAARAR
jgi:hypothetical protein